ncbi:MAG: T9SS type A sorting domain-containing protein [Bacteroidota bacterium]
MKNLLNILLIFCCGGAYGQNANSVWCFGDSAGIDFRNTNNPLPIISRVDSRGSCASISDSAGNLLFYANNREGNWTESTRIWNKNNQIMQNGDSIKGEGNYEEITIVPIENNLYYLFISCAIYPGNEGLYYCVIDMSLNGGLGAVTQKNIQLNNFKIADCIRAAKKGNGRDWWVVAKLTTDTGSTYNRFYVYSVSSAGISIPLVQDFGGATDWNPQRIVFNSNCTKLMQVNTLGLMCEYDFDRCSGLVSNPNIIFPEQTSVYDRSFWEGAYSSNDSLFYVTIVPYDITDSFFLFQYNLKSANIPLSCDTINSSLSPIGGSAIELAPDNKIYFSTWYQWGFPYYPYPDTVFNQYNMSLGVINSPNNIGSACDFQPFSFYLGGKRTYAGLPNNPNYTLGPLLNSSCDTVLAVSQSSAEKKYIFLFPNPAHDEVTFSSRTDFNIGEKIIIYDCQGQEQDEYYLPGKGSVFSFNISRYPEGIYFLKHYCGNTALSQSKLVVIR